MCLEGPAAVLLVALASVLPAWPSSHQSDASARPAAAIPSSWSRLQALSSSSSDGPDGKPPSRGPRVTVTLTASDRSRLHNAAVIMTPEGDHTVRERSGSEIAILPDGSFVFTGVAPGVYRIRARAGTASGGAPLFALYRIAVSTRDLDVALTLRPGATLSGRLGADGASAVKPATLAGVQIHALPADGNGAGETASGELVRDGSFTIRGVMPGRHLVTVARLPHPWVLQRVTYRGQDITDIGLDTDSAQSIDDVRVTITDAATDVSGTVRDADGRPVPGAVVLIIPGAAQFRTAGSRRFGRTSTDRDGHYRYRGLPPGDYRVVASMLDPDRDRPELLQHLNDAGVPLSLDALATPVIDLRLTPAITPQPASAR
jgi:hypothetical protein